jgi:hypothetical protein
MGRCHVSTVLMRGGKQGRSANNGLGIANPKEYTEYNFRHDVVKACEEELRRIGEKN